MKQVTYQITLNPGAWKQAFITGVKSSVSTKKRAGLTLSVGLSVFILSLLLANPQYSWQMITSGTQYWSIALQTRFYGVLDMSGVAGVLLTSIFSFMTGITLTNTAIQLKMNSISYDALGAIPGIAAAGCASCGVGVLSLLGLGAVMASLPFNGNLLRLGAVMILLFVITRTGDPETCKL